jgi:hypothetical protein
MGRLIVVGFLAYCVGCAGPAIGAEAEKFKQAVPEDLSDAWERLQQVLQEWGGRLKERFGARESAENRPAISQMLTYKEQLGLSPEQVKKLEQLRDNFQRQSIRNEADAQIVELDIAALLDSPTVMLRKWKRRFVKRKNCAPICASRASAPWSKRKPCSRRNSEKNSLIQSNRARLALRAAAKTRRLRNENHFPRSLARLELALSVGRVLQRKNAFDARLKHSRLNPGK